MTTYEKWLRDVAFGMTGKGARLDLRLHIYPDGHGTTRYRTPNTGEDRDQPVATMPVAADILQALRRTGRHSG